MAHVSYRNTQQYVIISSPVVNTGMSQKRKKNFTCPDATSNPKSLKKLGRASHPGSSLVCYNCFQVLAAEVRSNHLGDCTHCFVFYQTCRRPRILGGRDATGFHWFFSSPPQGQSSFLLDLPRCSAKTASKAALMGEAGTGNMQQGNEEEKEEMASLCDLW